MAYAKLTQSQINLIKTARTLSEDDRRSIVADVFGIAKDRYGIPTEHRLKVEVDNTYSPDYGVLIRKKNGQRYDIDLTDRWVGAHSHAPQQPVTRWFKADLDDVTGAAIDSARDNHDWEDGASSLPGDPQLNLDYSGSVVVVGGQVWVRLEEADL